MENSISVLIVEDEEVWLHNLTLILDDFGYDVAKAVTTADDALDALGTCDYDLVLLDINLNGRNSGIQLGKMINTVYKKPFIYITASERELLKEAAATNPSAYLAKPVHPSSLFIAINNAINNFQSNKPAVADRPEENTLTSFFVKQGSKYKKVDWKDVVYLAAGKNYVSVFNSVDKAEYYIRSSLQKTMQFVIPKQLKSQFIQVNRAEVVQFSYILELMNDEVKTAYKTFTVSEMYLRDLKQALNIVS